MDLDNHADEPTPVTVGNRTFLFSELTLELGAKLQNWIKDHVPNPLQAIKSQLDGFSPQDRAVLLDQARREAAQWPPVYGTPQCIASLGATPAGQIETFRVALLKHQPDSTADDAKWLWRRVRSNEEKSTKIFKLVFGTDETDEVPEPTTDPKG